MLERGLYMKVPRMYTTIKNEVQQDENLSGILKARTKKACPLPQDYGPVNWYTSPLDKDSYSLQLEFHPSAEVCDRVSPSHGWSHQSQL